jgi:hypothetical protein
MKGVELFKKKLVDRDPFARLQDRVMERSGVTPVKHHTNYNLRLVGLSPIKQLLEGKFKGPITHTSWSGDPVDQVNSEDPNVIEKRKAPTVEFALDSLSTVYDGDLTETALIVACGQFKAVWNGIVPQAKFIEMLTAYSSGKIKIKLTAIDPSRNVKQDADISSMPYLSNSLNLTRMATEKYWGVVALSRLWNHWVHTMNPAVKKLDVGHINKMRSNDSADFVPFQH